jgi:hypothetical protein
MHAVVDELGSVDAVLLLEVGVEPGLDVVDNGLPATRMVRANTHFRIAPENPPLVVVDKVAETGRVDDSQLETHPVLFDLCRNFSKAADGSPSGSAQMMQRLEPSLTCAGTLNLNRLAAVLSRLRDRLGAVQLGLEEGVDERGLAEAGLAWECQRGCSEKGWNVTE